jgi:DNA-binding response OmpR family regulator
LFFLTGLTEEEEIKELMECAASGIIKKPINLKEFPNQVKELWSHV